MPLPPDGTGSADWWKSQLDWAIEARRDLLKGRRDRINAYRDKLAAPRPEAVRVNIEYEKTEQKRHQLFFRVPTLRLRPKPRTMRTFQDTGQDLKKTVLIFREVLQHLAGKHGMHTKKLMDKLLFDVLCPAGLAACKVGYERFDHGTVPIRVGQREVPQPGSVLGLASAIEPVFEQAPNTVHERYYASRISPGHLLVPPDFTENDYAREADWLGWDFHIAKHEAKRRGWPIPDDAHTTTEGDEDRLVEIDRRGSRGDQLYCREVWCYSQRLYAGAAHPQRIRRLVFIDGEKEPVVDQDGRDQVFDARGRLIRGIQSLPIKVLTLRYISDFWVPPSDCEMSQRYTQELSEGRTQMIIHRRKAVPMRQINTARIIDERVRDLILKGEYYDLIPAESDDPIIQEIARAQYPRENFHFNDIIMADIDRVWALGANQQGVSDPTSGTATEAQLKQRATDNRLTGEQGSVIDFWLDIMEAASHLVQLYADFEDYVEIVGPTGANTLEAWDKTSVQGDYLFEIVPDSASRPDAAADRDLALKRYNLLANEPHIRREQLLRDTLDDLDVESDPDQLIKPLDPPKPDPPRVTFSIKGEDLNPAAPQFLNIMAVLNAAGLQVPLEAENVPSQPSEPTGPAQVVDREHLEFTEAAQADRRAGGLSES